MTTYLTDDQEKAIDAAIDHCNSYYAKFEQAVDRKDREAIDKYNDLFEYYVDLYANRYGYTYSRFEDACLMTYVHGDAE